MCCGIDKTLAKGKQLIWLACILIRDFPFFFRHVFFSEALRTLHKGNNIIWKQNLTLLSCPCLITESTRPLDTVYFFLLNLNLDFRELRSFRMIRTQPQPTHLSSFQCRLLSTFGQKPFLQTENHFSVYKTEAMFIDQKPFLQTRK